MLSNKKTEKFFLKDMRTEGHVFGERQNSSGGLRPPQQSMIQTLLLSNYSELYWEWGRPRPRQSN